MPATPRLLSATASLAILVSNLAFSSAASAQGGASTGTLDLSLNTGSSAVPASSTAAPRRQRFATRGGGALPSRGGPMFRQSIKPVVLGKLGMVAVERASLRAGRDDSARLLSAIGQGTYLAIVSEVGEHYGVLMIDRTTGWIPKTSVRMIDYQVAVGNPVDAAPPSLPPAAGGASDDAAAALPEGLDARTVALLREAFSYLGVPYTWAGNTRSGIDCSGFVKKVFETQGVVLPRHSGDQARVGLAVAWQDLQAGDRLYFDMGNKGRISHTGIYLGNGYFIHASSNQGRVGVDHILKSSYYRALVGARRS